MVELTYDVDTGEIETGDTLFVFDKDAAEYRETTVESAEKIGYSTKIEVEGSDRTFGTSSAFDHAPGDFAYLALPENVEEVAEAFASDTGVEVEVL